ncbi:hypothetical protein HRG_002467 [Hirsutella rhossiliensis]|uniref:Uncharacterized protein n=1 Tax=Hirsutella rhossiliensis TaxID=111463 RepID=A0A9P8N2H2_9HYPO|nr:uncharacterized protein HRG_02467 [Hirsutella rhossiliensis]KAH0967058.1 hypothetical protein HRG_02467 [Hirsutella rhossiliensis]
MSGKTTRGWDANSHEALLLAFIEEIKPNKGMITLVTERMKAMGYTYSYDAINQHVQKLRKGRDLSGIVNASSGGGTPTKTTPSKAGGRQKKTPSKRSNRELTPVEDDDEVKNLKREAPDAEVKMETPKNKRVKKEPVPEPASDDSEDEI